MSSVEEDIRTINDILDQTVRRGMQADGGDLEIVELDRENKILKIRYQGACGSCPMATMGTLMAIQNVLKERFDPGIDVRPV
jgi:Fe-S cluster biogenesis protein NfuA